ncbi:MAG: hypothetical protein U1A27_10060 [Phycisphaerae bacterium]
MAKSALPIVILVLLEGAILVEVVGARHAMHGMLLGATSGRRISIFMVVSSTWKAVSAIALSALPTLGIALIVLANRKGWTTSAAVILLGFGVLGALMIVERSLQQGSLQLMRELGIT